jgi:hypothetical protein
VNTTTAGNTLADELGLISEDDYAAFRRITLPALRNERWKGKGPAYTKVGGRVFYYRASIRQHADARAVTPQPPPLLTERRKPPRRPK